MFSGLRDDGKQWWQMAVTLELAEAFIEALADSCEHKGETCDNLPEVRAPDPIPSIE
jgi:hypothetical protein